MSTSASEQNVEQETQNMGNKAHGHLQNIIEWLESATYTEKAMAVAYDMLANPGVADILQRQGLYDGDLVKDLESWAKEAFSPTDADLGEECEAEARILLGYMAGLYEGSSGRR